MPTPYHVRLAVTQYGEQFRAELFTEDLGDTEGDLLPELPPSLGEWVPFLSQGAELPPDAARQLGKDLFTALLGHPENAKKWSEVLAQAERKGQTVRLLIDATTDAVRDLPYGLLCEPHDDWFLFRGGRKRSVAFVRILRRCSPRPLNLRERLRVLVTVAEPRSADVPAYDAPRRLQQLAAALREHVDLFLCGPDGPRPLATVVSNPQAADPAVFAPYTRTTREALRKALAGEYDVFHLLAHGHGAGVLLCDPDGSPAEATASELAEWCGAGRTSLGFLQVCKAGSTTGRGGFGGVAQQLLNPRGGNLAAVVASTFPLDAEYSTQAAVGFYRRLAAGTPPEEALTADRPETDWCWAFLELWARPGALGGTEQRAAFQFVSPYRGLSSFAEQDADLFFGRRAEVNELLQILRAEPVVAVVGDSGSGKSSLLEAGLVHAIRREGLAGRSPWRIVTLRPGYRPAQALLAALTGPTSEPTPESLREALRTDSQPLVLVFDQFEEVFTLARDRNEVQVLTTALAEAAAEHGDRFRLVLGMRSEFLGQAASVPGLSRLIRRPWVLRPPGADHLREIVAGPAEHCGYTFQGPLADGDPRHAAGLLDRILSDPLLARGTAEGTEAAPLPLLQFALERLWLKAVEKGLTEFTHAGFDELGGLGQAIAQHAEGVFQAAPAATGLGPGARPLAEQIITSLVSAQGTRQPRVRADLLAETGNPDAARAVLDYLVGERLLTVRSDPEDLTKSLIDLSHEALIRHWDRLRGWLAEDPQGRAMREEFRKAADQWAAGFAGVPPRSRFGLPGSDVATNYLAWVRTANPRLSPVQQEFAAALQAMLTRERRRRRVVMGLLGSLTVASSFLAIYAAGQARAARRLEGEAKQSEADARASEAKAHSEERVARERSAALTLDHGIRLCEQGRSRLGMLSIADSLATCPPEAADLRRVIRTNLAGWAPLLMCLDDARQFPGHGVAASPDGRVVLIALSHGAVQLFDAASGEPIGQRMEAGPRNAVWGEVMRDGDGWVVLTYGSRSARLWDGVSGQPLGPAIEPEDGAGDPHRREILIAAIRPDRKGVAVGMSNGHVRVREVGARHPGILLEHEGPVHDMAFTPDGKMLLTGCSHRPLTGFLKDAEALQPGELKDTAAGIARFWDLSGGKLVWCHAMPNPVTSVGVSPDPEGRYLAVGAFAVVVYDRREKRFTAGGRVVGHEPANWTAFHPKEPGTMFMARASGDVEILRVLENAPRTGERLSPQGLVVGAGFREDGVVFTLNRDGTLRLWRQPLTQTAEDEFHHPDAVLSVAFAPGGTAVAAGCRNGTAYLWPTGRSGKRKEFTPPARKGKAHQPLTQVRVSTDDGRLIAQDLHFDQFVWEIATRRPVTPPAGETLVGVADDGATALVRLPDLTYRVENLLTGVPGKAFIVPGGVGPEPEHEFDQTTMLRVARVAFSPDRSLVATIDGTGRVLLWRAATGEPVGRPIAHPVRGGPEMIRAVAFSPDGALLVTQSFRARGVWDAATGAEVDLLHNPVGVQLSRFSPCGRLVLSATNFNMAQAWDVRSRSLRPVAFLHAAQVWGITASADCSRILTASYDHTARSWDAVTGKPLSPPVHHAEGVSDVVFSPDGKHLLTGGWDRVARLWPTVEPVPDEVERVTVWVETMTGLHVGHTGSPDLLTAEEWRKRKERLDALGGPPWTHVRPPAPSDKK